MQRRPKALKYYLDRRKKKHVFRWTKGDRNVHRFKAFYWHFVKEMRISWWTKVDRNDMSSVQQVTVHRCYESED